MYNISRHPSIQFLRCHKNQSNTKRRARISNIYILQDLRHFQKLYRKIGFIWLWCHITLASFGHHNQSLSHGVDVSFPMLGLDGAILFCRVKSTRKCAKSNRNCVKSNRNCVKSTKKCVKSSRNQKII